MTSTPGVDYAWSHPGGAALQKAGKKFACRYLSPDSSKNLSRAEADDLAAHGLSCVVVWESTASRAKAGQAAGAADAKTAAAQAAACGMPPSRPIYFAVDFDATPGDQTAINAYLDGAASVLGRGRVGIYGGYYPVKRALDAGKAKWAWQTIAWSGGQWDARAVIRQGAQTSINGVSCDLDTALAADYGQWTPGHTPQEDDVPDTVNLGSKPFTLKPGTWTDVQFATEWADEPASHAAGGAVFAQGKCKFTGSLSLSIDGLPVGETVQVRMAEYAGSKHVHDHPIDEAIGTKGNTFHVTPLTKALASGRGMRVRLLNNGTAPVKVTSAVLTVLAWKES